MLFLFALFMTKNRSEAFLSVIFQQKIKQSENRLLFAL